MGNKEVIAIGTTSVTHHPSIHIAIPSMIPIFGFTTLGLSKVLKRIKAIGKNNNIIFLLTVLSFMVQFF